MTLKGEDEYIRSCSSLLGEGDNVDDFGIFTGAAKGFGVLCEIVFTGCKELVSLLTCFNFLESLSFFPVLETAELGDETFASAGEDEGPPGTEDAVVVLVVGLAVC